jgi:hypothetical protein
MRVAVQMPGPSPQHQRLRSACSQRGYRGPRGLSFESVLDEMKQQGPSQARGHRRFAAQPYERRFRGFSHGLAPIDVPDDVRFAKNQDCLRRLGAAFRLQLFRAGVRYVHLRNAPLSRWPRSASSGAAFHDYIP